MSIERSRYHDILTYCSEEQVKQVYRTFCHRIVGIAHILHDKDTWTAKDELKEPEHKANVPKEAHRHIIVRTVTSVATNTVVRWFKRFQWVDEKAQPITVRGQGIPYDELGAVVDYLVHLNDPDKYQYDKSEIRKLGDTTFLRTASVAVDDSLVIIDRLNDNTYPIRQLVAEYGKDFVYHFNAYRDVARAMRHQEALMLEIGLNGAQPQYAKSQSEYELRALCEAIYDNYLETAKVGVLVEKGEE